MNWKPIKDAPLDTDLLVGWEGTLIHMCVIAFRSMHTQEWVAQGDAEIDVPPTHFMEIPRLPVPAKEVLGNEFRQVEQGVWECKVPDITLLCRNGYWSFQPPAFLRDEPYNDYLTPEQALVAYIHLVEEVQGLCQDALCGLHSDATLAAHCERNTETSS